jgi:hypothetical protein
MRCGLPPPAAPRRFGCGRNVNVSFVVTSATALNEDLRLEVAAACAFDIVAYTVAVFLRREPGGQPLATIHLQPGTLHLNRIVVLDFVRQLQNFLRQLISLCLARARISQESLADPSERTRRRPARERGCTRRTAHSVTATICKIIRESPLTCGA